MKTNQRSAIFFNGSIYTGDETGRFCEAVVTAGEYILFAGSEQDAMQFRLPDTEMVNLQGRFMMPGFIDSHLHLVWGGEYLSGADLSGASSREEFVALLNRYVQTNPSGWVKGGNWNQFNFTEPVLPDKSWIDGITPGTPVLLHRMDYHIALANSAALAAAGISRDTVAPAGGEIMKDAKGEPTGILKDAAISMVAACIPSPDNCQIQLYIQKTLAEAAANGICSVHDITLPEHLPVLQAMEKAGQLTARVYTRLPIEHYKDFIRIGVQHGFGSGYLKAGSLKAFADGSLGAGTAYMFDAFADEPDNCGLAMEIITNGSFRTMAHAADANHLQLSVHAIGDRANNEMLTILAEIARNNPHWDRRHRIEHAQHVAVEDIARFGSLGVIASMQPLHQFEDGGWIEQRIGSARCIEAYPIGSLLRSGAAVCFGSDFPIVSLNPLAGIKAAVTRKVKGGGVMPGNAAKELITVAEAIACYTRYAAFAAYEEHCKGSIEAGKLADFVVLDRNIFLTEYDEIDQIQVLRTFVGAKPVFG